MHGRSWAENKYPRRKQWRNQGNGNPKLTSLDSILHAVGLRLSVEPVSEARWPIDLPDYLMQMCEMRAEG